MNTWFFCLLLFFSSFATIVSGEWHIADFSERSFETSDLKFQDSMEHDEHIIEMSMDYLEVEFEEEDPFSSHSIALVFYNRNRIQSVSLIALLNCFEPITRPPRVS